MVRGGQPDIAEATIAAAEGKSCEPQKGNEAGDAENEG